MKIGFSLIVKDDSEVKNLKNALYSVLPYVDFAQITSNGKKTAEIEVLVKSLSGIFPKVTIDYDHLPWNDDFSAQRNHSFNKIKDVDFIFWMDTDDILVGGEYLRDFAKVAKDGGKDVVFLAYWYACEFTGEPSIQTLKEVQIEHYRERLIRPGVITWKGRLHETPVPVEGQKNNYSKFQYHPQERPLAIMHTSSMEEAVGKMERNQKILELQLKEERETRDGADPRTLLYLMKIYSEIGDSETLRRCIGMGHEYLTKSGWDEERANACDIMAICATKLGEYYEAIKYLHQAISEYPHQPLHYVRLALAYFNVGRYRESKHWLDIAGGMELDDKTAGINNIKELKVLFAQLTLKLKYQVDKDIDKSVEAAELLYKEQPIPENKENLLFLQDRQDLKNASENALKLLQYLEDIDDNKAVEGILDSLPEVIREQPFAIKQRQRINKPRTWADNEICYFANFGGKHFEKWDATNLKEGIGGSETAVIQLTKEWAKLGYKVTVYGDPKQGPSIIDGVTYLPWYHFNKGDKFNIFIQWRNASLAPIIKCKKFLVDLHDVVAMPDYTPEIVNAVDKIMVKSQYHRGFLPDVPDDKIMIVSNGITV